MSSAKINWIVVVSHIIDTINIDQVMMILSEGVRSEDL